VRPQLISLLALTLSFPAAAWDVRTDSEGDVVHWARPVVMTLDSRAATQLHEAGAEAAIRLAVAQLDDATPYLDVSMQVGDARPIGYVLGATDNQNSIVVLEDWPYSEDALAVTLVTLNARTNELLDADVAFNVEAHHFRVLPEAERDEHRFDDVQNTITHELGHVLGLMHNAASEDLVMYPSAPPGEILKRALKRDDRDGLLSLYGVAPDPTPAATPAPAPLVGCSATSSPPVWMMLVALGLVLLRRPKLAAIAACVPALVLAAEPASITRADDVALVQVASRQSLQHPRNPGLILTELTLAPVECLKGSCAALTQVLVAGGRLGDLEQIAVHEPVPALGQRVLITRTGHQVRVVWLEPEAQGQIVLTLRARAVSTPPQGSAVPPLATPQVPAITP
jgi:uncharacterized protein (TIGR03382 family)